MDLNIIFKTAETDEEFDSYFQHLSILLAECNGKNGQPYFTPRDMVPEKSSFLKKFKSDLGIPRRDRNNQVFLAIKDSTVIAHCVLVYPGISSMQHRRHINGFGVDPKFQKQGIARRLLEEVIKFSKNIDVEYLDLELFATNLPALKLYESFGFEKTGYTKDIARFNDQSLDDLSMSLRLL